MGKSLQQDPTTVIAQLSAWLSDENSPPTWTGFALSIRALAYEVMDESELARLDYVESLQRYEVMAEELGKETLQRMKTNINFIKFRLSNLPLRKCVAMAASVVLTAWEAAGQGESEAGSGDPVGASGQSHLLDPTGDPTEEPTGN